MLMSVSGASQMPHAPGFHMRLPEENLVTLGIAAAISADDVDIFTDRCDLPQLRVGRDGSSITKRH